MEVLIWQYAKNKYGHVSAERFLSGAGLSLIYEALAKRDKLKTTASNHPKSPKKP